MELRLSNLAKTYPASGIRKMFDLAAGYDDVIALTLGEPNFETPAYIKEAAKKALDENYTHYAPNAGLPVLREAIAKRYQKSHWAGYKAEDDDRDRGRSGGSDAGHAGAAESGR